MMIVCAVRPDDGAPVALFGEQRSPIISPNGLLSERGSWI